PAGRAAADGPARGEGSAFCEHSAWTNRSLLIIFLIGCHRPENPAAVAKPDDIILITIDTLRADSVGFAGNTRVKTPFLDRIASEGIVFTNAHAHNVVTLPSHTNIITGLYPYQHGVRDNAGFKLDAKYP